MREKLIPRLIEAGIIYHIRKGIRRNCECSYCQAKAEATNIIGNRPWLRRKYSWSRTEAYQLLCGHFLHREDIEEILIHRARWRARRDYRAKLKQLIE